MVSLPAGAHESCIGSGLLEVISSLQNKRVRDAVRLHTSRGRKQQDRIIIFGLREVQRAISAKVEITTLFLNADYRLPASSGFDTSEQITVTEPVFEKLAYGNRVDGVIAVAKRPERSLDQFQANDGMILVVESIEKPGNLGAIIRSADATGVGGIIVSDPVCDVFHPNVIRNSTGTVFSMPVAVADNLQTISWLQKHDHEIAIATPEQADDLYNVNFDSKTAIVLGSEAHGLSATWMQGDFKRVRLPMNGVADSLNVSVTAAVIMYEAMRQNRDSTE